MTETRERLASALSDRYRVERELGRGGMATVFLAHDVRHDRKVAIKVLHPELAAVLGAERFLSEIRTTANLQHPHILPLHDSGNADGLLYFVMPYVEGESLRDLLVREKQLPVADAVRLASEIADALDYAHRHGVVHRDIKPENILLHDGRAQVADFGIARAVSAAGGSRLTETGLSLGTPTYMSPEQATGEREVDRRTDIYSLGCVLYEMLAGEPPFTGPTGQAILARVLTEEPRPLGELRKTAPENVVAIVHKAMARLPADRFATAAELADAIAGRTTAWQEERRLQAMPRGPSRPRMAWPAATVLAVAFAVWAWNRDPGLREPPLLSATLVLPDSAPMPFVGEAWLGVGVSALALSPDGTELAWAGSDGTTTKLYLRRMADGEVRSLAGTEGAYGPFFSPDGLSVGFFAANRIKRVPVAGGDPVEIAAGVTAWGAAWSDDGHIYYAAREGAQVMQIPEDGGATREIARPGAESGVVLGFFLPSVVPQSDFLLASRVDHSIWTVSLSTGETRRIIEEGTNPRYLGSGHVVFGRRGTLMAARFDRETGQVTSDPFPVLGDFRMEGAFGAMQATFAETGLLVYAPGTFVGSGELGWVDRVGNFEPLGFEPKRFGQLSLSRDGLHVVVEVPNDAAAGGTDIWWYDLARGEPRRLTTSRAAFFPAWLPDGESFAWTEVFPDSFVLRSRHRTRSTEDARLVASPYSLMLFPSAWNRDGEVWAYSEGTADGTYDILARRAGEDLVEIRATDATEWGATFSPEGDLVAYTSDDQGGDHEVWVEPYPPTGERWQVSSGGGNEEPLWSARGDELFFRSGPRWMRVPVESTDPFERGSPELLFRGPYLNVAGLSYGVSPDASRFLVIRAIGDEATDRLNVHTDWGSLIRSAEQRAGLR